MKRKHILIIQFRTDASYLHERMCFYRSLLMEGVQLSMVSSLDNDVDWKYPKRIMKGVNGVILAGSGEFHFPGHQDERRQLYHDRAVGNAMALVRYLIRYDIPTLGICFGHQMLGHALGVKILRDPRQAKKAGVYPVRLTLEGKEDTLFSTLPEVFLAQYAHMDSLERLPKGCVLLAHNGDRCRTSAFRCKKHIYGVQFHPEFADEKDFFFRLKISDAEYSDIKTNIQPTHEATSLLKKFIACVVSQEKRHTKKLRR